MDEEKFEKDLMGYSIVISYGKKGNNIILMDLLYMKWWMKLNWNKYWIEIIIVFEIDSWKIGKDWCLKWFFDIFIVFDTI